MIKYAFLKLKERKYVIQSIIFMIIFTALYFILDYLNYREATIKPDLLWIIVNSVLNIIMATASTILMSLSTVMVELKSSGESISNLGFLSVIFGIFTYGCTSCVVIFLSAVGISFSPAIFPFIDVWYGILYKLLSLVLIALGLFLVLINIEKGTCKVKLKKSGK